MSGTAQIDDNAEFARLLVQHDRAVFRYILTFVYRHADAEEILQRTAMVLWRKFAEYDATREFLPWAMRVAYFEILKFRAEVSRSRLIFREDILESLADTRETQRAILDAQMKALQECLGKISAESAALLKRRYCDAQPVSALAAEKGKTAKSFYRRLDRLRDLIADCIERRIGSSEVVSTLE